MDQDGDQRASKEQWLRDNPGQAFDPDEGGSGGGKGGGQSKEQWLRDNPGEAVDPERAPGEGMSKEDYLRQSGKGGTEGGGRY